MLFKCYACKEMLPEDSFAPDKSRSGSRKVSGKCKPCSLTYQKLRRETNPNARLYHQQYYEATKERHQTIMAKWRSENKNKMLQYWHNYKAKQRANGPIDEDIDIIALIDRDDGICQICKELCLDDPSIDHIKPVSKGGTHTWDNVQLAHRICNIKKGAQYASAS